MKYDKSKANMEQIPMLDINTLTEDVYENDPETVIKNISKREWTFPPYSIQSWGSWLHRLSPYVGRIKPSFAHFLIKYVSQKGDTVLDPFCGIGTIPTQAAILGRNAIGVDLNPYAYYISLAKTDNKRDVSELVEYLSNIKINTSDISLNKIPEWVREYYNQETLKEILYLITKLKKDEQWFILGNLVGISQGHRVGHLSKPCAWTLPYKPRPDDKGEYREVLPRLIEKVKRTYKSDFRNMAELKVHLADARNMPVESGSIDHIISSPPYFDTLDYVNSTRLRLAILGFHDDNEKNIIKRNLIQKYDTYKDEMYLTIKESFRVLRSGGYCIFIVGDCFKGKKVINTAEELKPLLEDVGFTCYDIIQDEIPINKSVQKKTTTQKHDRIMILRKP